MRICISSLKFSPGHYSHAIAYAKAISEVGYDVFLLLNENYKKIDEKNGFERIWYSKKNKITEKCDLVIFLNASTINHAVLRKLRTKGAKVIYLYHEPWDNFWVYLKTEGLKQVLRASISHYFSVKILRSSDLIIVPSKYALNIYEKYDKKFNENVINIPLLFEDELTQKVDINNKKYFSYIGHAVKGHAFDKYLEFIKYLYRANVNVKFEIATKTNLNKVISKDKILQSMIADGTLKISHGKPLKNQEINQAFENSFCVWNLYRRSTQSGVLPKAFMFGTPVLAARIGSFPEYIKSGFNGEFVSKIDNFDEIYKKLKKIKDNLCNYSKNARYTFLNTFYYQANIPKLLDIIIKVDKK
ncbi:glycosyl transferase family 1 [Thermosipho sp. 1063]|uniref:glycosyltransferase family 4 protein n=1 Tax=Thermosipho sp. 1063 TaxID=1462747 RepID=UPI00095075E8|nr:glycosyltransferase family 4 protein [Thermosipho sp. 1063]APT72100.1 glycosyl transferase family 1 [Thermosipho sp. 1063]